MSVKNIARAIAEKSVDYLRANGKNGKQPQKTVQQRFRKQNMEARIG